MLVVEVVEVDVVEEVVVDVVELVVEVELDVVELDVDVLEDVELDVDPVVVEPPPPCPTDSPSSVLRAPHPAASAAANRHVPAPCRLDRPRPRRRPVVRSPFMATPAPYHARPDPVDPGDIPFAAGHLWRQNGSFQHVRHTRSRLSPAKPRGMAHASRSRPSPLVSQDESRRRS